MKTINMVGAKTGTGSYNSYGLTNDHPVNLAYDPTKDTSLQPITSVTTALPLFGTTNSVQCGTCHEPHNNTNTNYCAWQTIRLCVRLVICNGVTAAGEAEVFPAAEYFGVWRFEC